MYVHRYYPENKWVILSLNVKKTLDTIKMPIFINGENASKTLTALSIISQEERQNMQTPEPMIFAEY